MEKRSFALLFVCALALQFGLAPEAWSRTWPTEKYEDDPNYSPEFRFGYLEQPEGYSDPDFVKAERLDDPTRDFRYQSYNVIVVVNKRDSPVEEGQTVRVYTREQGLVYHWYASTARQGKVTPDGYFTPEGFSSEHRSSLYNGASMPWAVFFNGNIATHGIGDSLIPRLGDRASAGCVRLEPSRARELFHLIGNSGEGYVERVNDNGDLVQHNGEVQVVWNYKTLIVVK